MSQCCTSCCALKIFDVPSDIMPMLKEFFKEFSQHLPALAVMTRWISLQIGTALDFMISPMLRSCCHPGHSDQLSVRPECKRRGRTAGSEDFHG